MDAIREMLARRVVELEARNERLRESLEETQAWITDGGFEDDPDIAFMCGKARAAMAETEEDGK